MPWNGLVIINIYGYGVLNCWLHNMGERLLRLVLDIIIRRLFTFVVKWSSWFSLWSIFINLLRVKSQDIVSIYVRNISNMLSKISSAPNYYERFCLLNFCYCFRWGKIQFCCISIYVWCYSRYATICIYLLWILIMLRSLVCLHKEVKSYACTPLSHCQNNASHTKLRLDGWSYSAVHKW